MNNETISKILIPLAIAYITWISYTVVEVDKKVDIVDTKLTSLNGFFQEMSEK